MPAFVKNTDCDFILNGLGDIINVDIVAKYSGGVGVFFSTGVPVKPMNVAFGSAVSDILGETICNPLPCHFAVLFYISEFAEAVLCTVGFVGYNHDIHVQTTTHKPKSCRRG